MKRITSCTYHHKARTGACNRMIRAEDFQSSARVPQSIMSHQGLIFYRRIELNDASERSNGRSLALNVDYDMSQARTAPGGFIRGKLRLSLATLTFLFFFSSTTLLTSYFYPLDWAPIAF